MNSFTLNYRKTAIGLCILASSSSIFAGSLDSLIQRQVVDTSTSKLNMDASYNRPFLTNKSSVVAIGGYLEANSIYSSADGVNEGLSFQARRLTMFMSASISNRITFLSELEIEEGGKEIAIEFAAMDISFHPFFNLRGGIVMNPIGAFNQNHDGPKWEFIERPVEAVDMLPATFSNAGFGLYGKVNKGSWIFGYEAYFTNGFDGSIIDNEENRTFLPAVKENEERFEESSNGVPLFTGKIAIKNRKIGEIGFSYMRGVYNPFNIDDIVIDKQRTIEVFAIDFKTQIKATKTKLIAEGIYVLVDVPSSYSQQYGNKQSGAFVDLVQPVITSNFLNWKNATFNIACRFDYADWNIGRFKENNELIGDELWAITPAISFRPSNQTVIRLNYQLKWEEDLLMNPPARTNTWLFGFSTYF